MLCETTGTKVWSIRDLKLPYKLFKVFHSLYAPSISITHWTVLSRDHWREEMRGWNSCGVSPGTKASASRQSHCGRHVKAVAFALLFARSMWESRCQLSGRCEARKRGQSESWADGGAEGWGERNMGNREVEKPASLSLVRPAASVPWERNPDLFGGKEANVN